jgi:hypothetical protein
MVKRDEFDIVFMDNPPINKIGSGSTIDERVDEGGTIPL